MLVDVNTYRIFFNLLWEKFKSKEFHDDNPMPAKVTDVWKAKGKNGKHLEDLTRLRFEATPLYFYKLKPPKKVKTGEFEVSDLSLAKALAYIEDEEAQLVNGVKDWGKEVGRRWERFKETYAKEDEPSEGSRSYDGIEIDNDLAERIFLDVVANNENVFFSKTIQQIITNFFDAISSKRYYNAWLLLTREAQDKMIWKGEFEKFEHAFSDIRSLDISHMYKFSYTSKEVSCLVGYTESGCLYDISRYIDSVDNNGIHNRSSYLSDQLNWIDKYLSSIGEKSLREMSSEELLDYNFQKLCRIFFRGDLDKSLTGEHYKIEYEQLFDAFISCRYFKGYWLIDNLNLQDTSWRKVFGSKYVSQGNSHI